MKKVISLLIAVSILMLTFAGCGTQKTGEAVDDVPTLKWYFPGSAQTDIKLVEEEINKTIVSKIGAKVELKCVDFGSYDEKMNMLLSSGETFDIAFASNWTNNFLRGAMNGAFVKINDYLKDSPIKEVVPDFIWDDTKVGSDIFGVPNYQVEYYQPGLFIPKKLVDKYKLDVSTIKCKADIEPFLAKIKAGEPDLIPFNPIDNSGLTAGATRYSVDGVPLLTVAGDDKELKLQLDLDIEGANESLYILNDWYKKGYIRKDILSADNSDNNTIKYAVFGGGVKPGMEADLKGKYGEDIVVIPTNEPIINVGIGQSTVSTISRTSKYPDKAFKLLELMNTDKALYNLISFGIEGTHYDKISENVIKVKEDSKYSPNTAWMFGCQFNAYYLEGQKPGIWEETDKINKEAVRSPLRGFIADFSDIKSDIANISAIVEEYKWISYGVEDPDKVLPEYKQKLKQANIDGVQAELQKQIDEWRLSNKK